MRWWRKAVVSLGSPVCKGREERRFGNQDTKLNMPMLDKLQL